MNLPSNWPKTLVMLTVSLFTAILATAADGDRPAGDGVFIATTGRIVTIDLQTKMLRVRASDSEPPPNFDRTKPLFPSPALTFPSPPLTPIPPHYPTHP